MFVKGKEVKLFQLLHHHFGSPSDSQGRHFAHLTRELRQDSQMVCSTATWHMSKRLARHIESQLKEGISSILYIHPHLFIKVALMT